MNLTKVRPLLGILDLFGRLPYFRGKGLPVVWLLRLLNSRGPLPVRLPDQRRILFTGGDPNWVASIWLGKLQPDFTRVFWRVLCALPEKSSVIDIGAHIGYYALIAAHRLRYTGGMVFAFEPHPVNFSDLQRNKILNSLDNLIPVQKAVADRTTRTLLFAGSPTCSHSLRQDYFHDHTYEVECITLDDFISSNATAKIGLVKIDAEGAELLILRSAQQVLARDRPYIMYEECEERYQLFGHTVTDVRAFLQQFGYTVQPIDNCGSYNNAIAVPEEQEADFFDKSF